MPKRRLTDRTIKALKPAEPGARYDLMDNLVPGLGVRVTDKGQRTFVLVARYPGSRNPTRRALGEYGALTLEGARDKARRWHDLIQRGVDPKAEEERARLAEQRRAGNTFASVAEDFIRLVLPKQRKGCLVERQLRQEFVARFGSRPIDEVTQHDIVAVLDDAVARGAPYTAHNLLGIVRRLFNWAISRGIYGIDRSPCDRMKPSDVIGKKAIRTRVLNDDELRALWAGTETLAYPFGAFVRLLLLTGQRKSEVAGARWTEFDLTEGLWTIPASRMKSDAAQIVPLSDAALRELETLPKWSATGRRDDNFLFSYRGGRAPINGFSKEKARLDKAMVAELQRAAESRGDDPDKAQLKPFVLHDIRRTVRTRLSALRVPETVAELVIAHGRKGLARVYDQHKFVDEMREALDLWAGRLRDIVEPPPENVVELASANG